MVNETEKTVKVLQTVDYALTVVLSAASSQPARRQCCSFSTLYRTIIVLHH